MKSIIYTITRAYLTIGLFFYYKKIKVHGKKNIPKNGAVLFVCNHQNALIDSLIVTTTSSRRMHVLTRAGVFKKKFIIYLFGCFKMIPIYRIRDGWNTLQKNDAVFEKCFAILNNQKPLIIFPEGSHNLIRKVRPLSKGFTRILFGAIKKHPDLKIQIVPIGLNYNSIKNYPASVSIYYGKPFEVNQYFNTDDTFASINKIKEVVKNHMKELTIHIEDSSQHDAIVSKLEDLNANFLDPIATNKLIEEIDKTTLHHQEKKEKRYSRGILYYIVIINSFIPWVIWRNLYKKIKEKEFISTFRFGIGITLFPLFYVIQSIIINYIFDSKIAIAYFIFCLLTGLFLTKFTKVKSD